MVKVIQSPIKKLNWTDTTGIWTNTFMASSVLLFLLFVSPFAALGANLAQTDTAGNRTMIAISMTLYSAAMTVFLSSFLGHSSRLWLCGLLMALAILFSLTHAADNENAKSSSYAAVAMIGIVLIFVILFGRGKDSSELLLTDSVAGNYIFRIDHLLGHNNYINARQDGRIPDGVHKKIMNKRKELESYLWSDSRQDYRIPGTTNHKNFINIVNSIDRDILGSTEKAGTELSKIITGLSIDETQYKSIMQADRLKFMGEGKKDKKDKKDKKKGSAPPVTTPPVTTPPVTTPPVTSS